MSDVTLNHGVAFPLERILIIVQAVAGILFSIFLVLHLVNIFLAPLGAEAFDAFQEAARVIYQHPVLEILIVIGPIIVHLLAGLGLYLIRRQRKRNRNWIRTLHFSAGLFLLLVIFGHIAAVRGPSFFYDVYPRFEGVAFSLWFSPAYFYPYYFLLALAGLFHASNGLFTVMQQRGVRFKKERLLIPVSVAGAVMILISLLSFGGVFFDTGDPAQGDYAQLVAQLFGIDVNQPWK